MGIVLIGMFVKLNKPLRNLKDFETFNIPFRKLIFRLYK
jgi:hypothetical protein